MGEGRNRLQASKQEELFALYKSVTLARHNLKIEEARHD